jgi:uncharacterized protein YbjT (DUF2867 family)
MKKIITVAGATGDLGQRIIRALINNGAEVHAIVRTSSSPEKINQLQQMGVTVYKVNMLHKEEVAAACAGASCVVSALSGLRDVIIDTQKALLDAAIIAGVPRFIPSDYSLDFTTFSPGENRNLDWRREFHQYLDQRPIKATSVFNGAFAELITNEMPLILFKQKLVLYWGNADQPMNFTTKDDIANYTALAALDDSVSRYVRIAGDQISPRQIRTVVGEVTGKKFRLFRAGSKGMLSVLIKIAKVFSSGEKELYPAWQGMQYMRNMIDERSNLDTPDQHRYPSIKWTTVKDVLTAHVKD